LGIGANGDGEKALRLLVRIQAGHQIRTVDELYKEMILERPATYEAADRAISHFDDLEAAYLGMNTELQKATCSLRSPTNADSCRLRPHPQDPLARPVVVGAAVHLVVDVFMTPAGLELAERVQNEIRPALEPQPAAWTENSAITSSSLSSLSSANPDTARACFRACTELNYTERLWCIRVIVFPLGMWTPEAWHRSSIHIGFKSIGVNLREVSMDIRTRVVAVVAAALAGLGIVGATTGAAWASADARRQAVQAMNFWMLHSSYGTHEECEAAAQEYLWPQNPTGADGYECRANGGRWELWLMFLS
jgi:hypothetical protein